MGGLNCHSFLGRGYLVEDFKSCKGYMLIESKPERMFDSVGDSIPFDMLKIIMVPTLCLLNVHDFVRPNEMYQYFGVWHIVFSFG